MRRMMLAWLWLLVTPAWGGDLMMVRSTLPFPETMARLQQAVGEQGYRVARVQRVDIGLTRSGYATDKYRILFFGRRDEIERVKTRHPALIPYVPLKIVLFAEGDDTLVLAGGLAHLRGTLDDDPGARALLDGWTRDLRAILEKVSRAGSP